MAEGLFGFRLPARRAAFEALLCPLGLPDRAAVVVHRGGPLSDDDGVDGAVVEDHVAGAAVAAEPEGGVVVAVAAGFGDRFRQVAGAAVARGGSEGGRRLARGAPAVLFDPVGDGIEVVTRLVAVDADPRADHLGEVAELVVVSGGELAPGG